MIEKVCSRCLESKPVSEFTLDKGKPVARCKKCIAEHWRLWHGDRRQSEKEQRDNRAFNQLMAGWPSQKSKRTTEESRP